MAIKVQLKGVKEERKSKFVFHKYSATDNYGLNAYPEYMPRQFTSPFKILYVNVNTYNNIHTIIRSCILIKKFLQN